MILALETATAACSVAVGDDEGRLLAEVTSWRGPAHTQRLLPDVHHALRMVDATVDDVRTVVVGLGPGTFTGLRIGVATARALAQALSVRLEGVPTIAALGLALADGDAAAKAAALVPLIDGRRGEVFAACYARAEGYLVHGPSLQEAGHCLDVVRDTVVVEGARLQEFLSAWPTAIVGGDGAVRYAGELLASAHLARGVAGPSGGMVLRAWACGVPGVVRRADAVLPIYARPPDAVRWTQRQGVSRAPGEGS